MTKLLPGRLESFVRQDGLLQLALLNRVRPLGAWVRDLDLRLDQCSEPVCSTPDFEPDYSTPDCFSVEVECYAGKTWKNLVVQGDGGRVMFRKENFSLITQMSSTRDS